MESLRPLVIAAICWMAACGGFAQNTNLFDRVLVPITVTLVPGAYGSVWSTELWYRNNSTIPVAVFPLAVSDFVPTIRLMQLLPVGSASPDMPGRFLFVTQPGADQVQFDLRLFNRASPEKAWGTKIPVVRDREFASVVSLINVPVSRDFRCALRIYGLPHVELQGQTVAVRIYSAQSELLAATELGFEAPQPTEYVPRYAQILSLADAFPEIGRSDRVTIEVASTSGLVETWAFVSVTANATQEVVLVTPN